MNTKNEKIVLNTKKMLTFEKINDILSLKLLAYDTGEC